ncbi:MAG: hypothetical protein L6R37_000630 [Teloschistes peruensis]|nr:MAG: hypothetical protein L6R37_000630 [Teloschistes peruensis]
MSAIKNALKAAKAGLDAHQYDIAIENSTKVLTEEPKHYHANVFLGLALEKKGRNGESEKAYRAAASTKPNDPLAWQGLISLYEQQGGHKLEDYREAVAHLASIFMEACVIWKELYEGVCRQLMVLESRDDKTRCQTVVDKYTDFARKCGSRAQYRHSLEFVLPGSDLYEYLEGRLPHPSHTYTRISEIVEQDEKEKINFEIGQRRTRLGAMIDQVTAAVKKEVLQGSVLESLYQHVIDWTDDDDTRRLYEEKLLQHAYDTLLVLPQVQKNGKREEVIRLAQGMVIIKHPFALAWKINLEWKDIERLGDLDVGVLREYVELFPEEGLGNVLRGYLESEVSAFPARAVDQDENQDDEHSVPIMTVEDRLVLMADGLEDSPKSVLAHRIMSEYYLFLDEHESAAETARKAQRHIVTDSQTSGLPLANNSDAINILLGTALVQYQAPRHHPEARSLFESILVRKPANGSVLLGIGLILEKQEEFHQAVDFFERAMKQAPSTMIRAEVAWCRALGGDYPRGLEELEDCLPSVEAPDLRTKALKAQILYRIGMCLWDMDHSKVSRRDRNKSYARFISALQTDANFAPPYTMLGIYYADYAKDRARARKCFQKAFELSSSEVVAAERLARSFAKTSEWDLVEVVAQRVIESGRLRPAPGSKKKGISWPFAALGVVQLNKQEYAKSIVSFQSALRISPKDYYSWVGLGECYHNSGRYIAATKAFEQAQKLERELGSEVLGDTWFSKYMLANVQRELGEYDAATGKYKEILNVRAKEYGVSISYLQISIESAWRNMDLGFFGRAIDDVQQALRIAKDVVTWSPNAFNLWKCISDLYSVHTYVQSHSTDISVQDMKWLLEYESDPEVYSHLAEVDQITWSAFESVIESKDTDVVLRSCLYAAILAQKRALRCCAHDPYARATAWYNLGWTEHRAYVCQRDGGSSSEKGSMQYLKAAVQCFKRAIELESRNAEFWNSLGIVTSQLNRRVAQHAFVRSLYLNEKNAKVWTNLGVFYLIEGDIQLANDSFARAQSVDPDHAQAWLGQGLLAAQLGESSESRTLFTHAFDISDASAIQIQQSYASSTLDHLLSSPAISDEAVTLLQPLLALRRLSKQTRTSISCEHIYALFQERIGSYADASTTLLSICSKLEADYEKSESAETLERFAQSKADLSRSQLAKEDFESATDNAETALALTEETTTSAIRVRTRLSAHLSAGMACYYQGSMDRSIYMFKNALEETQEDPDIVCLLTQVLWAKGGGQERSIAREQLFDCMEKHPGHVGTILLLGVIAVLDDDRDTVEAVSDDLHSLRTRDDLNSQQHKQLAQLLHAISVLYPANEGRALTQMSEARTAVMLGPSKPYGWSQLANLSDESHLAEMAVLGAVSKAPPRGESSAEDISEVYAGTRRVEDIQKAIMLAPWSPLGWQNLSQL